MTIQTQELPYELLVRWDLYGALQGAHFQKRYITRDGDILLAESIGNVEPIDPTSEAVQQIMTTEQAASVAALASVEALKASLDANHLAGVEALNQQRAAQDADYASRLAELNAVREEWRVKEGEYRARIRALEAQLGTLENSYLST